MKTIDNKSQKEVSFNFPGRIQMCPLDFNAFDFEKDSLIGGGGYGFSVKTNHFISIKYRFENNDHIYCNCKEKIQLIQFILNLMKQKCDIKESVDIYLTLDERISEHSGLGTNSSLICACVTGLNTLFDNILTKEELIDIVKNNYYETFNNKLIPGLTTGVSFQSFFYGGFVVVGDEGKLIINKKLDKNFKCYLIDPLIRRNTNSIEDIKQLENSRELDKNYKYEKAFDFLTKVIPALNEKDYSILAKYNYKNQLHGGQKAVIESYPDNGQEIKRIMSLFETEDIIVGLSSCGPSIYVLTTNQEKALSIINKNKLRFIELQIQNEPIINI